MIIVCGFERSELGVVATAAGLPSKILSSDEILPPALFAKDSASCCGVGADGAPTSTLIMAKGSWLLLSGSKSTALVFPRSGGATTQPGGIENEKSPKDFICSPACCESVGAEATLSEIGAVELVQPASQIVKIQIR